MCMCYFYSFFFGLKAAGIWQYTINLNTNPDFKIIKTITHQTQLFVVVYYIKIQKQLGTCDNDGIFYGLSVIQ